MSAYRYSVTLRPRVSIAPDRFVRVVVVDGPRPFEALRKALTDLDKDDTHRSHMSEHISFDVERVG